MEEKTEKPVLAQLREMEIDQELTFPLEKRSSIQSTMSKFAVEWNKVFKGSSDKESRLFHVKRIA